MKSCKTRFAHVSLFTHHISRTLKLTLPSYELITTSARWQNCLAHLRDEPRLAVDLEANSMYAYREQVCLIQISTPAYDFIIDPLAGLELGGLGDLLANEEVEKVFHAAEYDALMIKREYGWTLAHLFDTMWAVRILGYPDVGLASLTHKLYHVNLDKRHQRANWCQRPLTAPQLAYAQQDTHYLLPLREHLAAELLAAGRWEEAQEIFREQCQVNPADNRFDPDSFWTINGVKTLSRQEQAVLRALYIFRDEEAQRRNYPLFKIFGNKTLLDLAQNVPRTLDDLRAVSGMTAGQIQRYGQRLLQVIEQGQRAQPPSRPHRSKGPSDAVARRYEKLHLWRKERARARGVESDVILGRQALWEIARVHPQTAEDLLRIESLGPWRRQTYGSEILRVMSEK